MRLRLLPVLALVFLPAVAQADMAYYEPPAPRAPTDEFWREVVAPHGDEIQEILTSSRTGYQNVLQYAMYDYDPTGENRAKLLDELYGHLRYARRLDPTQEDVLMLLGQIAEESGRASAAIEVLNAYVSQLDPDDSIPPEVDYRLGRAYMRLGRWDDAARHLRASMSQGGGNGPGTLSIAYLGSALMASGQLADAIDLLSPSRTNPNLWSADAMATVFTLAVAYDRDEQISNAFELLLMVQNMLQQSYVQTTHTALLQLVFVPAYDQHYYLGLFYESLGYFQEARTEWLLYASVEDAPYRGRALDHVEAIDTLLAAALKEAAKPKKPAASTSTIIQPSYQPYQPYGQPPPAPYYP